MSSLPTISATKFDANPSKYIGLNPPLVVEADGSLRTAGGGGGGGGTVTVSNFPATQTITGEVSVSGTVTTTVSNFPATQVVSGTVSVSNFPTTQAVSGSVSVTGSVAVTGPVTNAQLAEVTGAANAPSVTDPASPATVISLLKGLHERSFWDGNLKFGQGANFIVDVATPGMDLSAFCIHILEDSVISAYVDTHESAGSASLVGKTLLAGTHLYGFYTSLSLSSGSAICYTGVIQ